MVITLFVKNEIKTFSRLWPGFYLFWLTKQNTMHKIPGTSTVYWVAWFVYRTAISSVSGPYSAIDPYVKPFFTPQLCSQPWLINLFIVFHVCTSFCRIAYACFSFLRSCNFLMAMFSFCYRFCLLFSCFQRLRCRRRRQRLRRRRWRRRLLLLLREREEIGGIVTWSRN